MFEQGVEEHIRFLAFIIGERLARVVNRVEIEPCEKLCERQFLLGASRLAGRQEMKQGGCAMLFWRAPHRALLQQAEAVEKGRKKRCGDHQP
jgi:hypothetical protein